MHVMLAKTYAGQDPTGWWMSEKLNGVRAVWTGEQLRSKEGNQFFPPAGWVDQLPHETCLDGELFIGRGAFQRTLSVVSKKTGVSSEWAAIRYMVFDAPGSPGGFERRTAAYTAVSVGRITAVAQTACRGPAHLERFYSGLLNRGAEGVILRQPGSDYEDRRSGAMLKYTPTMSTEAVLVGYKEGRGKYSGRIGSLICEWRGQIIGVGAGLSDAIRTTPPPIGAMITIGYKSLTDSGKPWQPVFEAVRAYE